MAREELGVEGKKNSASSWRQERPGKQKFCIGMELVVESRLDSRSQMVHTRAVDKVDFGILQSFSPEWKDSSSEIETRPLDEFEGCCETRGREPCHERPNRSSSIAAVYNAYEN